MNGFKYLEQFFYLAVFFDLKAVRISIIVKKDKIIKSIKVHIGIDRFKNVQLIFPHSPLPSNTNFKVSSMGK